MTSQSLQNLVYEMMDEILYSIRNHVTTEINYIRIYKNLETLQYNFSCQTFQVVKKFILITRIVKTGLLNRPKYLPYGDLKSGRSIATAMKTFGST